MSKSTSTARKSARKQTPSPADIADGNGTKQHRFTVDLMKEICARVERGDSLHAISRHDDMPSYSSMLTWQKKRPGFAEAVAASKAAAVEYCMDQALDVARKATTTSVTRDRLEVSAWEKRADKMGPNEAKAGKAEPVEVVFYFRRFEKLIGEDGKAYLREIKPEGEA